MKPIKKTDQLLDKLEESINRLKLDYDIFFNGGSDQFPQKMHEELNMEVKRLFNIQLLSYAQTFRLNSLATRLSVYNDLWQRNLRMLEQGKKPVYGVQHEPETLPRRTEIPIASESDRDSLDGLFQAYCRAREAAGNESPVDPLRFEEIVVNKLKDVKQQKSCDSVVFIVAVENGDVQLRTRPKK